MFCPILYGTFSQISTFVFCLFNLGQAAPIIAKISSLATRELDTTLEACSI